jgi:hypothetical protein
LINLHKVLLKICKNQLIKSLNMKYKNFVLCLLQIQSIVKIFLAKNKIKKLKEAKLTVQKFYKNYRYQNYFKKVRLIQKYLKGL